MVIPEPILDSYRNMMGVEIMSSHDQTSGIRWVVLLVSTCLVLASPAGAQELELKRGVLSAGGVGYFEYEAQVEGDATLPLSVRLDQVDDVLIMGIRYLKHT